MKRRLIHPLWTHIPAATLLVGFVALFLSRMSDWPDRVPLQIGWSGEPTSWGSPWIAFGLVVALGLFFLALTVLLDELWARQESHKRFNFLSLLDELVIASLVTIQIAFLDAAAGGAATYHLPWGSLLVIVGGVMLLGMLVELKRPYLASEASPKPYPIDAFRDHLKARVDNREQIVYWDVQNPKYVSWLSIGIPIVLWVSAGFLLGESLWAACLNAAIGVLLLLFYGGQRTRVSKGEITIRYGLMGIRIFRCSLAEIAGIHIRSFAPLADFGGYGIRVARGVTAYYLAGRTGVQLDLIARRTVLIGSSNPERLAAVIETISGSMMKNENEVML